MPVIELSDQSSSVNVKKSVKTNISFLNRAENDYVPEDR